MLNQFRHLYPQGTIFSELINIDRGLYIVKVSLQDRNIVLGTGFAAAETIEKAEDRARERALMTVNLDKPNTSTTQIQQSQPQTESIENATTPNVTPLQTPVSEKPTIQASQEVSSYHRETDSSRAETSNNGKAIAKTPKPIEDIVPPPVEETQSNIFEQPITPVEETTIEDTAEEATETIEFDFNDIKHKTDLEMKRLRWTKEQGREYLLSTYGKRSRLHLTDEELLEFWRYLETLPN